MFMMRFINIRGFGTSWFVTNKEPFIWPSGYARVTGKPGVVHRDFRPQRDEYRDRTCDRLHGFDPMVVITGQSACAHDWERCLSRSGRGGHHPLLHQTQLPRKGCESAQRVLKEAFVVATTGRPGPVVDIPRTMQQHSAEYLADGSGSAVRTPKVTVPGNPNQIKKGFRSLALRPFSLALCGGRRRALQCFSRS